MSNRTCAVTDCGRPVFGHGWCNAHYKRWRKHGDPMSAIPVAAPPDADLANRFWAKVDKTDECWLWTGTLTSHGYGQFKVNNRRLRAHRVAYGLTIGPIPDGAILDHRIAGSITAQAISLPLRMRQKRCALSGSSFSRTAMGDESGGWTCAPRLRQPELCCARSGSDPARMRPALHALWWQGWNI